MICKLLLVTIIGDEKDLVIIHILPLFYKIELMILSSF